MRVALVVAALSLSASVAAQKAPKASKADIASSQRLFRVGVKAYDEGRFSDAAGALDEAYRLFSAPEIAFSAAQAYRLAYFAERRPEDLKRAVELYKIYLGAVATGGRRADAVANLAELEPYLVKLEGQTGGDDGAKRTALTRLVIASTVEGAEVSIDGAPFAPAPAFATVKPGRHSYQVRAPKHVSSEGTIRVFEGQFESREVKLAPKAGSLMVATNGRAEVAIDGISTALPARVRPGTHEVAVRRRGHDLAVFSLMVQPDDVLNKSVELRRSTQRSVAWGLLLGAGTATVAAGVFGGWALVTHVQAGRLDDDRSRGTLSVDGLDRYNRFVNRRSALLTGTYIAGGLAVGAGIAGAAAYWFDLPALPGNAVVTPTSAGVQVGASF